MLRLTAFSRLIGFNKDSLSSPHEPIGVKLFL